MSNQSLPLGPFSQLKLETSLAPDECSRSLKSGLTPELGMFKWPRGQLPVSGWVGGDRFRLRTRVRFSNGGSFQIVYGRLKPNGAGTTINIRFAIEALFLIALVMVAALVVVAAVVFHSVLLSSLAAGFFAVFAAYAWIGSLVERRRLLEYIEATCGLQVTYGQGTGTGEH